MFVSIVCGLAILVLGRAEYPSEPYRLPSLIKPLHYNISIITDLTESIVKMFEGEEWIRVKCVENTTRIILHSKQLQISMREIQLTDAELNDISIYEKYLVPQYDFFVINTQPLIAGKVYILFIPFKGYLDESLIGYYFGSYLPSPEETPRWYTGTQFKPIYARTAFPCFDEPAMKAVFMINLGHHVQYQAISNMHKINSTDLPGRPGYVYDQFNETLPMSTYLVAFFISEFEHVPVGNSSVVKKDLWCRPQAINQSGFAREVAPEIFQFYEDYFGIAYKLHKLDMVAIPDSDAAGIDNWGLLMFGESSLLLKENISTVANKIGVTSVISHEIAHQWFGNMVTMAWWTDLWLSEGFATYLAMISIDEIYPEWEYYDLAVAECFLDVFAMDALQSSHPLSMEISDPSEIEEIFDTIAYKKGALMLRMLSMVLSEDVFRKGTACYLHVNALTSTQQDSLWTWLNEEGYRQRSLSPEMSTKKIMDSWTLQSGYPLVTVVRNYDTGTAVVSQKRYFTSDPLSESAIPQCWSVPLSYTTQNNMYFCDEMPKTWISCDKISTIIYLPNANNDWVIFNIRSTALYKVQYDDRNWALLLTTLNSENHTKIDPLNRFQLVNDIFDLAFIGEQDYYNAFQFLLYLSEEREFLPWRAGFSKMEYLYNILHNTPTAKLYKKFVTQLMKPIYRRQLANQNKSPFEGIESIQTIKLDELVMKWSCRLKFRRCVRGANRALARWMAMKDPDTKNPIHDEMRSVAVCNALKRGGQNEWNFVFDRYLNSNVGAEKDTLIYVLGCSGVQSLLITYLDYSIDTESGIRYQDTAQIFRSVALNSPMGFEIAKTYFMKNIDSIHYYYGGQAGAKISIYLKTLAERIYSYEEAQDFNDFIAENQKYLTESTMGLKQAMETIQVNILWLERNYDSITEALTNLTSSTYRTEEIFSFVE